MAWDTGDLIAVGKDIPSLKAVIQRLKEIGGGVVFAEKNEIVAELPARVCGILSTKTMEETRQEMKQLENVLKENGVPWEISSYPRYPHGMCDSTFEDHPPWVCEDERPAGPFLAGLITRRWIEDFTC